eukprot:Phypoly_transcript_00991.p1 GENE.Phypoly_transcript_00991~~Phypoly_transcript_00991.p1  ORF type:complete len:1091 (-),score=239.01 Phypoly_transcript_00991:83-3355(-)
MPKRTKEYSSSEEEEEGRESSEDEVDSTPHKNKKQKSDSTSSDVGIIEKIELENFMCHKRLEIGFGTNINFIVGVNGSGKSAVLIGLAICLGAKAGFTSRASKLSDLIKTGSNTATITVKLRNQGPEAYKHEEYGDSIIVERKLHRDGGGAYKLKDATGKRTVSTTASELTLILEQFNIQVNNPCAILMQETSKQFLATAKPQDKYQFFLMATQMDQMKKDFEKVEEHIIEMKAILKKKEMMLPELAKQYKELEREYHDIQQMKDLEEDIAKLKKQLAWAFPLEKEAKLKEEREKLASLEHNKGKAETKMAKLREDEVKHATNLEEKQQVVEEINNKMVGLKTTLQTCEAQINELKKEQGKRNAAVNDLNKRIAQSKKRKETLLKFIQNERDKVATDSQMVKVKREKEVREKATEIQSCKAQLDQIQRDRDQANQKLEEFIAELQDMESKITDLNNVRGKILHSINQCEEQKKDRQRVYGQNVPALLAAIQKNKQNFKKMPLGPIGTYLKIKDPRWAKAMEEGIRPDFLKAFIVDSAADERALKDVCKQARMSEPPIFIHMFTDRVYQLDPNRDGPDVKFSTIFRLLESSQPTVMNALIDQRKVEAMVLVETREDAKNLIFTGNPPLGVLEVYTLEGTRLFLAKKGQGQNIIAAKQGPATILGANPDERIRALRDELARVDHQIKQRQNEKDAREKVRQEWYKKRQDASNKVKQLQNAIRDLEHEMRELENVPEEKPVDLSEQEEGVKKCDDEVIQLQDQLMKLQKNTHTNVSQQLAPLEQQREQLTKEMEELDAESEKVTAQVEEAVKKLAAAKKLLDGLVRDIATSGAKLQAAQVTCDNLAKELEVEIEKASRFCAKVEVQHPVSYLDKQISVLNHRLEQERRGRRNPAEVEKNYKETKARWRELLSTIEKLKKLEDSLLQHLDERHRRWIMFRKAIAKRTRIFFNGYLSNKGYTGSITFDHDNRKLDIQIQLDRLRPSDQQQMVKDTKSLSGGERSFSTVSLLLALWEAMETPFRAMDEFDVFMDAVNRRLSIEMLTEAGREHKHRQFLFISPHDTSHIPQSSEVRVIRMRPPERGQSTIDFSSQNA